MTTDIEYTEMLKKARKRNAKMSDTERKAGFASPERSDFHTHLRTVESALECAVKMKDWDTTCEAIVLLQQAIARVSPTSKMAS
jgi:hypothetical protein